MQQQNIQCDDTKATLGLHKDQFYSWDVMTMAQGIIVKQKVVNWYANSANRK